MLGFFYDLIQYVLLIFFLPKLYWDRISKGKFKKGLKAYLALSLPSKPPIAKKGPVFLLCAVSVGEAKAASSLLEKIKETYPTATIYIGSRTETGHAEAKKSLSKADGHFLLPFDFSWTVKRFLSYIEPDVVIIIESDFWYNFLKTSKQRGSLLFLASGKLSETSCKRLCKVAFLAKKLFGLFDLLCMQNETFASRMLHFDLDPSKVIVTGNLKFDTPFLRSDQSALKKQLGIAKEDWVVVVASTHHLEEESLLKAIAPLWKKIPELKLLLVPRHPERFSEVEEVLAKEEIPFTSYSRIAHRTGDEKIVLMDVMGMLFSLYLVADVAVLGGSFLHTLKGHNIFEPIQAGVPVIFGPYMRDQKDFVDCVLFAKAGLQTDLGGLCQEVESLWKNPAMLQNLRKNGERLLVEAQGSSSKTWKLILASIAKRDLQKKKMFEKN
jgi:3-deoxy-D-manno-octulosonic-acid transferase